MIKTIELGKVLNYQQPTNFIVDSDNYSDEFKTPVLTAGKSFILGYTNETHNIYQDYPVIIFDDFTTASKFVDFPFKVKSSAMKILSCDENIADIKFLFYLIQTIKINSEQHQRYWISNFSKINIPLPPLSVQKEIAEKLDKADALRKKDQELLKQYDELAQAIFIDMFGDPLIKNEKFIFSPLNEVAILNPRKSEISNLDKNTEISFVEMASVSEKGELIKTEKKLLSEVWNGFTYFKNNDVLFAKITPCMENGKGAIAKDLSQGIGFGSTEFHILRPLVDISNSYWIHFLVRNASFRKLAKLNMTGSAGQKRTPSAFFSLKVNLPPISLQTQFAEKIQNIEAQKEILKKQAQLSEELFQALLQESFSF